MSGKIIDTNKEYKYGFTTDIESFKAPKGLSEETIKFISKIKNKDEILEEEFDKFDDKFKPDENSFNAVKQVFEAYATDKDFRDKIDSGKYAELNVHPSGDYFFKLPEDLRNKIPTYIKENINLERFINA